MEMPFNILVIDDEPAMRDSCFQILSRNGCNVLLSENGNQGLTCLNKEKYDVVILDLKMPDINGFDVLKSIHINNPDTAVIIVTGFSTVENAVEAMKMGAYDYLTKPCEVEELVAKIEGAWAKKDETERQGVEEKIQRVVESPGSILEGLGKKT